LLHEESCISDPHFKENRGPSNAFPQGRLTSCASLHGHGKPASRLPLFSSARSSRRRSASSSYIPITAKLRTPRIKRVFFLPCHELGVFEWKGVMIGPNPGASIANAGVASSLENRALGSSTQRRRVQGYQDQVQGSVKEARGLLQKQKQTKKSESFTTSQRRKVAATVAKPDDAEVAAKSGEAQQLQMTSVMKSASSPYKITPGPPDYSNATEGITGYEAYGPRLDVYSAGLESWRN